jgi:hypothetical protein
MADIEIYTMGHYREVTLFDCVGFPEECQQRMWKRLEKKYLPSLPIEDEGLMALKELNPEAVMYRYRKGDALKEVRDLVYSDKPSDDEVTVMLTAMRGTFIERELLQEVADLYRTLDVSTGQMAEQGDILEEIYNSCNDILGVFISIPVISADVLEHRDGMVYVPEWCKGVGERFKEIRGTDETDN